MTKVTVNPHRHDPYKNFKFRIFWEGGSAPVAGMTRLSGYDRPPVALKGPVRADPDGTGHTPGRTEYEAITLERGVTSDPEFLAWANAVSNRSAQGPQRANVRRTLLIEMYNEAGHLTVRYRVFRCCVSEFQALPDLDANANAVAIEHMKLEHQGWERDDQGTH